jgi:hypothetical protein
MRIVHIWVRLVYEGKKRCLANSTSKLVVLEPGNPLVVRFDANLTHADQICSILVEQDHNGAHEDSLYQFYVRIGHQSYAAIEELASKPEAVSS